jgi:hypothetical protein
MAAGPASRNLGCAVGALGAWLLTAGAFGGAYELVGAEEGSLVALGAFGGCFLAGVALLALWDWLGRPWRR